MDARSYAIYTAGQWFLFGSIIGASLFRVAIIRSRILQTVEFFSDINNVFGNRILSIIKLILTIGWIAYISWDYFVNSAPLSQLIAITIGAAIMIYLLGLFAWIYFTLMYAALAAPAIIIIMRNGELYHENIAGIAFAHFVGLISVMTMCFFAFGPII